jgi:hypothetical protein
MNLPKPDTFVLVVAAMSEKMVSLENQRYELEAHIRADHEKMDDMQRDLTDKRRECEEAHIARENLSYDIDRLRRENGDLRARQPSFDYYKSRCEQLEQELLALKFNGETDPLKRVETYMNGEGGTLWSKGMKIECIKGVRMCTGWGLKEAKDWCEANGGKFAHKVPSLPTLEDSGPHTKPSQDMVRKSA